MERYAFATFRPEDADVDGVEVFKSEERTNGTGFRRMPDVKGRWVSGGRE